MPHPPLPLKGGRGGEKEKGEAERGEAEGTPDGQSLTAFHFGAGVVKTFLNKRLYLFLVSHI